MRPGFPVRPGENLVMRVAVTVPKHFRVTSLWLGISGSTWGTGPGGRPIDMHPILAHSRQPLSAGVHTFRLRWRVPEGRSGDHVYLGFAWHSRHPSASVAGGIAELALR
jgi:hypothetical protein